MYSLDLYGIKEEKNYRIAGLLYCEEELCPEQPTREF